ncbi:MAG: TolC family protein [Desulfuromonadales bacterium]|nr:TolC family protein [Desulfuromonadales bacterium]
MARAETLSLQQALVLGMQHNFDLRIASLDVARADAGILGEEGRFDVTAELGLGVSRSETPAASALLADDVLTAEEARAEAALSKQFASGLQTRLSLSGVRSDFDTLADRLDPAYRTLLVLDFSQPLLKDLGTEINTANLQIAKRRQQQAALGYLDQAQQLAAEIERAYLSLAQADQEYRYATLARDLARELLDGNQRKFQAGLVPVSEVNEASSAMAGREENMLLVQQQVTLARNRLLELIDHGEAQLPADWQAELPDAQPLPSADLAEALQTGFKQRPDLQQARLDIAVRKIALVYADNQRLPRLDLEASLGVNGLAGDAGDSASRYDGAWQDSASRALEQDGSTWYAGLRFNMPLQNRAAKAQYLDAAAQDKQSLYRLRRVEVSAETAIRSAHALLELGRERLEVAHRYATLAQATLDQENRRLQEGLSNTFRVLTFQNALVTARTREVAAQTDYYRAEVALQQAMGTNLERYNIVAAMPHEGALP